MKNNLTTTNQNAKLALSKSKSLLNITNSLVAKKANSNLEQKFKFKPFLIERGHLGFISNVVVTYDGKYIVSERGEDVFNPNDTEMWNIKIWDTESSECLKTIKGYEEKIDILKITQDGKYIVAVSSHNNKIIIWDFKNGKLLHKINISTNSINLSPDSKYIITGDNNKTLKIWDIKSGECLKTLQGHNKTISYVLISSNGEYIISADVSNIIKIWNNKSNECLRTIKVHDENITSIVISENQNKILVICNNYIIKIWDFKNGNFLKRIDEIGPKNLMIITNDLKKVITVNSENIIELWDLENYEVVKKNDLIISKESRIINISTTGKVLIRTKENTIEIWNLENTTCLSVLNCIEKNNISKVAMNSIKQIIAIETWSYYSTTTLWNIKNGELIDIFDDGERLLEISNDGKTISTIEDMGIFSEMDENGCYINPYGDRIIRIYDTKNGKLVETLENDEYYQEDNYDNKFVDINPTITYIHSNYEVQLMDTKSSECILTIIPDYEIAIDRNGYFIVADYDCIDKYIRISEAPLTQRKLTKEEVEYFCKVKYENKNKIPEIDIDEDEIPF